jgi:16S rRNA G527 N7-methylase RsmG
MKNVTTHKKAAYLMSLNESEKAANFKIIDSMNKRVNFLRNPRFKKNKAAFALNKVSVLH